MNLATSTDGKDSVAVKHADGIPEPSSPAARPWDSAASRKVLLLDRAYADYCRRREQGETLDSEAYLAQFPSMKFSLGELIYAHEYLVANTELMDAPAVLSWPESGGTFLDFHFLQELGQGAFARVFLAREPKLGNRLVAVKISERGGAEAEILGRIRHPNVVPIHSVQEDEATGVTAVCMPYEGSATLVDLLDRVKSEQALPMSARVILETARELKHPIDLTDQPRTVEPVLADGTYVDGVRWLGACLASALAFLHEQGIYHRDLKPSNVLLSPDGKPMLLDFNLSGESSDELGPLAGTLPYMDPELIQPTPATTSSAGTLQARADIYSLGVILHELLTGEHPYGPLPLGSSAKQLYAHLTEQQRRGAKPAALLNPQVDRPLSDLIARCLAVDPAQRPESAAAIALALKDSVRPLARAVRWVRRHPWRVLAASLACAGLLMAAVVADGMRPAPAERLAALGNQAIQEHRYQDAVQCFTSALEADPMFVKALLGRAHAFQQLGATQKHFYNSATADLRAADEMVPDGRTKAALGYCFNCLDRDRAAAEQYRSAIQLGHSPAAVHNNLGYCYLKFGDLTEAQNHLDEAIRKEPRLAEAYQNRAVLALKLTLAELAMTPRDAAQGLPPLARVEEKKRGELVERLKAGIADAQKAQDLGATSAELSYDAARLCALAAGADPKWREPALGHLEYGLRQGLERKSLQDRLFDTLRADPGFAQLQTVQADDKKKSPSKRIVDPGMPSEP